MATAGDVFHNPITGERVTVLLGADDTDGRYLAATMDLPAADRCVGAHSHPDVVEAVEVLHGEVAFRVGGERRVAGPGERFVVPRGVRHAYCNVGETPACVRVEAWPARRFELLAGTLIGLARDGLTDAEGHPDPLQWAVTVREFSRELRPGSRVARLVARLLAPLGRLCGRRPYYARHATPADRVPVEAWEERPEPRTGEEPGGEAAAAPGVACPV